MKRILFSDNTAWGLYNFRRAVILHFIEKGFEVHVCVPYDPIYSMKLEGLGCKVHPIRMDAKGINPLKDVLVIWKYYRLMRKTRPNLSITYTIKPNLYGGLAASLSGIHYLAIVPGAGTVFTKQSFVTRIVKCLYKIGFKRASHVWFLNKDDAALFQRERLVSPENAGLLDGEGIDLLQFPLKEKPMQDSGDKDFIFLMTSRLIREKGVCIYAEAAGLVKRKYKKVRFQLLGMLDNPPMKNSITEKELGNWQKEGIMEYLGATSDVSSILRGVDVLVLPSYYREGIPRSLMEGAATGLPLITTDQTGCREMVIEGYNGFLCKPRDAESLAMAMERMINLPAEERHKMGINGRHLVEERFDIRNVINCYEEVVNKYI